jgi:hypothetical protein
LNSCDSNALCTNTVWDYTCACDAGYEWDGNSCSNIDECATGVDLCDDSWVCSDTDGGYDCSCSVWYYNFAWSLTQNVNTCLEIDECSGQVEWLEEWYQTITDSPTLNQWDECTAIWWICSNEIGWFPWFSCDCPQWYEVDGQGVCQVVFGDSFVVSGVEECDLGALWTDDGCSDTGQRETPLCTITVSPTIWTIGTQVTLDLGSELAWWTTASLIERWDGTIIENPWFPVSTSYSTSQQYTITLSVQNTANLATMSECTTVVAIDTECGNTIQEQWEVCDLWDQNWVVCSADFGSSCTYCTASCTQETITNDEEAKQAISLWYSISHTSNEITLTWEEQWSVDFFRVEYGTVANDLTTTLITAANEAVIGIDEPESVYYIQVVPVNDSGEVNWIVSELIEIAPIQDVEPLCGNEIYETDTEQCDQWVDNGQLCDAQPWFSCEYCSSTCEVEEHSVPSRTWWSSSSVSVSVAKNTVTEQETSPQEDQGVAEVVDDEGVNDNTLADESEDTLNLLTPETGSDSITHSAAPSLYSLFAESPTDITPESLSELLRAINRSSKTEVRVALERYLLEK